MEVKDWIMMIVPILFNGVIIFSFQKTFERKQQVFMIKCKYINKLKKKVSKAISRYLKLSEQGITDQEQRRHLDEYIKAYLDVCDYFIPNNIVLAPFRKQIQDIADANNKLYEYKKNNSYDVESGSKLLHKIFTILQDIEKDCINLDF